MSIGGTVVKTGTKTVKEGMDFLSKQIAELTTTLKPVAKDASDRVIVIGRDLYDQAPSVISKYPRLAVGVAGVGGAGAITGAYMGLEAISPVIPGDFNFAFGTNTPGGNVWKPYNPKTGEYEDEKKDYAWVKYVAIGGIAILGIGVSAYLLKNVNTTVSLVAPGTRTRQK